MEKTKSKGMKYYILERHNPQFDKPYYAMCGRLPLQMAKERERGVLYGYIVMLPYDTESEYLAASEDLKAKGFNVSSSW